MALHPQARALLDIFAANSAPPLEQLTVSEARAAYAKMCSYLNNPQEIFQTEDRTIKGYKNDISIRIYTPSEEETLPALIYFHGGGWVIGNLETHDALCRALAIESGCKVLSVDYSLAPEAKFPNAVEDAYLAVKWAAGNAGELGIDKSAIAVAGDSAGGNLATVVCYLANQRKEPSIMYQMLFYPSTGYARTPSFDKYGEGYHLTKSTMKWFQEQYLNSLEDTHSPLAAPMIIPDSETGLMPPAYIMTAEYDPLCDGGEMYAKKLQKAGVETMYVCYPGMIHGFLTMTEPLDDSKRAIKDAARALRKQFSKNEASSL
ncbi:alpha/beta hydrolase [Peribacillus glennii]|nr:alpha/beta hydrolase [Peribacillus glennii]